MLRLRDLSRNAQRGAVSTIGVLLAILVIGLTVGIGVRAMSYQTHMTMEGSNQMQSQSQTAMLETRMARDAASAGSVYFPATCVGGVCDDIRFGKRNTDGTWSFWGYAAVPAQQGVAYCTYSLSNSARCSSPLIATGIRAFRADLVPPSSITAAIGGPLAGTNPEMHFTAVYANASDPFAYDVWSTNEVVMARFATARDVGEVHLVPGAIASNVAEVANTTTAAARGWTSPDPYGGYDFVQGTTVGPPNYTYPTQFESYYVDRYNSSVTFSSPTSGSTAATSWPDNGSNQYFNCANVGGIYGNLSNNATHSSSGVSAQLAIGMTEANPGLCYFNVAMDHPNANDTPTTINSYIDVYGPLLDSPTALSFVNPSAAAQTATFSETNLVEGNQGGNLQYTYSNCATGPVAGVYANGPGGFVANGTDSGSITVTPAGVGSCTAQVTGAWGTTLSIPITVGPYSPLVVNIPNPTVLANSSVTTGTYTITEANDPQPFTLSNPQGTTMTANGGICLFNSAGQCFVGVYTGTDANGSATVYMHGNIGTGLSGSSYFTINDGHGQLVNVTVTVNQNPIVGGINYTAPNSTANSGNQTVSEGGYTGAFSFNRQQAPASIGASTSMCIYTAANYCFGGLYTANDASGSAIFSIGSASGQYAGGSGTYNISDSTGYATSLYTLAVNGPGGLTGNPPNPITLANSQSVSATYYFSEANDPYPFTYTRQVYGYSQATTGAFCLYTSAGVCAIGLNVTADANGYSTFYVYGNSGSGDAGSATFSLSDSVGTVYTYTVTVNQNAITGPGPIVLADAGATSGTVNVAEAGYTGAFDFYRVVNPGHIGGGGNMCLYDNNNACVAALQVNGDSGGAASYYAYGNSSMASGGRVYYYVGDANGYYTAQTYVQVNPVGTLVSPGASLTARYNTVTGPFYFTESNDYSLITITGNTCSTAVSLGTTTNTNGDYGFTLVGHVNDGGHSSGSCQLTGSDGHGQTAIAGVYY